MAVGPVSTEGKWIAGFDFSTGFESILPVLRSI